MDKFYIITNSMKDPDMKVSYQIQEYLTMRGKVCQVQNADRRYEGKYRYTNPDIVPEDAQCVVVLGGDGTMLQAARDLVHKQIPLLGVNMGTLGFLAEVEKTALFSALDQLIRGEYKIEERMMLRGRIFRGDELIGEDLALNDIVISRDGPVRVIKFINYVNEIYLNSYNADGIIISTPTGSTGYSLSAGGPVVSPKAALMLMTPLAPHTMNARPIVFPPSDTITVELGEGRRDYMERGRAYFDGDNSFVMMTGDKIVIDQSKHCTKIIKLSERSFVEVLRQKMKNN